MFYYEILFAGLQVSGHLVFSRLTNVNCNNSICNSSNRYSYISNLSVPGRATKVVIVVFKFFNVSLHLFNDFKNILTSNKKIYIAE